MAYTPQSDLGTAVKGFLERLAALQKLVLPDIKNAVPYPYHAQDSWPYFTNSLEGLAPSGSAGDLRAVGFSLAVNMTLELGRVANFYDAQFQIDAQLMLADVVAWFVARPRLADPEAADTALHKPPRWMSPSGIQIRAGRLNFIASENNTQAVYVEFSLTVPINVGVI
jgi:hypothetical protein